MYLKVEFDNSVSLLTEWSRRCWYNVLEEGETVQTFGDLKKALAIQHVIPRQREELGIILDGYAISDNERLGVLGAGDVIRVVHRSLLLQPQAPLDGPILTEYAAVSKRDPATSSFGHGSGRWNDADSSGNNSEATLTREDVEEDHTSSPLAATTYEASADTELGSQGDAVVAKRSVASSIVTSGSNRSLSEAISASARKRKASNLEMDFLQEPESIVTSSSSAATRRAVPASSASSRAAPPAKAARSRNSSGSGSVKRARTPSKSPKAPSAKRTVQRKPADENTSSFQEEPFVINHKLVVKVPPTPSSSEAAASRTGGKTPSKSPSKTPTGSKGAEGRGGSTAKSETPRRAWSVGDTIFAKVATWYQPDECPFPNTNSWFCKGSIVSRTARTVVVKFPCFDAEYNRPLSYVDNFTIPDLPKGGKIVTKADIRKYDPNS